MGLLFKSVLHGWKYGVYLHSNHRITTFQQKSRKVLVKKSSMMFCKSHILTNIYKRSVIYTLNEKRWYWNLYKKILVLMCFTLFYNNIMQDMKFFFRNIITLECLWKILSKIVNSKWLKWWQQMTLISKKSNQFLTKIIFHDFLLHFIYHKKMICMKVWTLYKRFDTCLVTNLIYSSNFKQTIIASPLAFSQQNITCISLFFLLGLFWSTLSLLEALHSSHPPLSNLPC